MKRWILTAMMMAVVMTLAGFSLPSTPTQAEGLAQTGGPQLILTVNSLLDDSEPGGDAGDGLCDVFPLFSGDACTLRAAIEELNAYGPSTGAPHRIEFSFSGATPYVIAPNAALPTITVPVEIDGTTVAGASCPSGVNDVATLHMVLDGVNAGDDVDGLRFEDGSDGSMVQGLVIGNFNFTSPLAYSYAYGIYIGPYADNVTVRCNFIGVDWTGATVMPNDYGIGGANGNTVIGGTAYAHRNVISGNTRTGINVDGTSAANNWVVKGNFIGVDATGFLAIPNGGNGILIQGANAEIGGPTAPERNIIAGNNMNGIVLSQWADSWTIVNNYIGVAVNGVDDLGNGRHGIDIEKHYNLIFTNNTIGALGQGNTIAYNGLTGILVEGTNIDDGPTGNFFRYNSIFANDGLGINLSVNGDGVTPNDPAPDNYIGPNGRINFPTLSQVKTDGANVFYTLSYEGATDSFEYDLYLNDSCDPSGYGEGQTHVYANSFATNGSGVATLSGSFAQAGAAGKYLVATATRNSEGTSEFSSCALVTDMTTYTINDASDLPDADPADGRCDTDTNSGNGDNCTLRAAIQQVNASGVTGAVSVDFNIPGGPLSISLNSPLPAITSPILLDATTQPGASCPTADTPANIQITLLGNLIATDGLTLAAGSDGSVIKGLAIIKFDGHGIRIDSNNNTVQCNTIGLESDGDAINGNTQTGVRISGDNNLIGGSDSSFTNVISGNGAYGVSLTDTASGNDVSGNIIGLNAIRKEDRGNALAGIRNFGGDNNRFGGTSDDLGNYIGGNDDAGIYLDAGSASNDVLNNKIGLDLYGDPSVGNAAQGIILSDADYNDIGALFGGGGGNVIAGNGSDGILLQSDSSNNQMQDNSIYNNGSHGLSLFNGNDNVIKRNAIHNNSGAGIQMSDGAGSATGNRITENSIYDNGGLGIDLDANGTVEIIDAHDVDTGANNLQNFPTIKVAGDDLTVSGNFHSLSNTSYTLEFFQSAACDASGNGEGRTYLGNYAVTTDGIGNAYFTALLDATVAVGDAITAVAINDVTGDSSEFSACSSVLDAFIITHTDDLGDATPGDGACDASPGTAGPYCTLRAAIEEVNALAAPGKEVYFAIEGPGPHLIDLASSLPDIQQTVTLDAVTYQAGVTCLNNSSSSGLAVTLAGNLITADGLTLAAGSDGSVIKGLAITKFDGHGLRLDSNDNRVQCNIFGLERDGDTISGNTQAGVRISGDNNLIGGSDLFFKETINIISGNGTYGVSLTSAASGNEVFGNIIGLDITRLNARGNTLAGVKNFGGDDNAFGGTTDDLGNAIGGNGGAGVILDAGSMNNVIQNNDIGLDGDGNPTVGNAAQGVMLSDADVNTIISNVIAGNSQDGILLQTDSSNNQVTDNTLRDNGSHGVRLFNGQDNVFQGNAIHNNNGDGIQISDGAGSAAGNQITDNSIHDNAGLGVDLNVDGVTPNDAGDGDGGANGSQNYPDIFSAAPESGGSTEIIGQLDSLPVGTYVIEFFANVGVDPSGYGEGETLVGSMTLSNGASQSFIFTLPSAVTPGEHITAIARDGDGNASEFSAAEEVVHCTPPATFDPSIAIVGGDVQLSWSSPASADFYIFRSADDPYFSAYETYDDTQASVWADPDANELGDAGKNYYYTVRGADGCASTPGQTVGEFDFALTPGTP